MEMATHHLLAETLNRLPKPPDNRHHSKPGYLYAVRCHDFVKIGTAANPTQRIACLQTGNPYLIKTIRLFKVGNMLMAEQLIHKYFDQFHVRGEWFILPKEILAAIHKLSLQDLTNFLEKRR